MIGAALLLPQAATTPDASMLDRWQVQVDPAKCTLSREASMPQGSGIALIATPGTDSVVALLVAPTAATLPGTPTQVTVLLDGTETRFAANASAVRIARAGVRALRVFALPDAFLRALPKASAIRVEAAGRPLLSVATPNATGGVRALDRCNQDQLVEWGADPAQFAEGGARPVARKSPDDFVDNATLRAMTALSGSIDALFSLGVDEQGRVDRCAQQGTSADQRVSAMACKVVTGKSLFTPAHGPGGTPVRGAAAFRIITLAVPRGGR
jgi:hypothetical protein